MLMEKIDDIISESSPLVEIIESSSSNNNSANKTKYVVTFANQKEAQRFYDESKKALTESQNALSIQRDKQDGM